MVRRTAVEPLFVEEVDAVIVVGAEGAGQLPQENGVDLGEHRVGRINRYDRGEAAPPFTADEAAPGIKPGERLRHVSAEAGQDRFHSPGPLPFEDASAEREMRSDPRRRQRPGVAVQIVHILPRQESRAGEEGENLLPAQTEVQERAQVNSLDPGDGQRHVDAVQRHEVDLAFPARPLPPDHRVAEGAVIQAGPQRQRKLPADFGADRGRLRRERQPVAAPGEVDSGALPQVIIQPGGQRNGRVSRNPDASAGGIGELEAVLFFRAEFRGDPVPVCGAEPFDQVVEYVGGAPGGRLRKSVRFHSRAPPLP